jgi:hypothetical protein
VPAHDEPADRDLRLADPELERRLDVEDGASLRLRREEVFEHRFVVGATSPSLRRVQQRVERVGDLLLRLLHVLP